MKQPTIKPWNEVTGDLGDFMATEQSPYLGYSSQQQLSSPIRYLTDVTQSNKTTPWYKQIKASQRHLCSQVMRVHFICVCVGESLHEGLLLPTFFFPPHQTFSPKCQTARYSYRAIYCAVWSPKPYHSLIYNHDVIHRIWGKKVVYNHSGHFFSLLWNSTEIYQKLETNINSDTCHAVRSFGAITVTWCLRECLCFEYRSFIEWHWFHYVVV